MKTLEQMIEELKRLTEAADDPATVVFSLTADEAKELLPELRNAQDAYERDA